MYRVVILGGESTGKSTLTEALASHYQTSYTIEFARPYLEKLQRPYEEEDLLAIARGQLEAEEQAAQHANRFLFCDTDLHVIRLWSEYRYGRCHPDILHWLKQRSYDAYLLTAPDIPWQDDPLREHPQPELRAYFFSRYEEQLNLLGKPWLVVRGDQTQRLDRAVKWLDENVAGIRPASAH